MNLFALLPYQYVINMTLINVTLQIKCVINVSLLINFVINVTLLINCVRILNDTLFPL